MAGADAKMKYPSFHMLFFIVDKIRKGNNVISNAEDAEMNKPGESSGYLDKPQDSQSLSNDPKGNARKRERSSNLSESSPEKKRPKTWSPKESQGSVQRVQLRSDLKAKTPTCMSSPTVATAPKATSSQGEKATGSKNTASTASDAIPSTSSGSGLFIATSDREAIKRHGAASYLADTIYNDRCAFGSEILKGNAAWQVNVQFRLSPEIKNKKEVKICQVGFWTDQKCKPGDFNKILTLNMVAIPFNILRIVPQGHGTLKRKDLALESETAILKIAFVWSASKKMAMICMDGDVEWKLRFSKEIEICPIFILEETEKNEAVIAVNLKVDTEIESSLKSVIEKWAARKTRQRGCGKKGNTKLD